MQVYLICGAFNFVVFYFYLVLVLYFIDNLFLFKVRLKFELPYEKFKDPFIFYHFLCPIPPAMCELFVDLRWLISLCWLWGRKVVWGDNVMLINLPCMPC